MPRILSTTLTLLALLASGCSVDPFSGHAEHSGADGSNHGDYRVSGSVEIQYLARDATGQDLGRRTHRRITGPEVFMEDDRPTTAHRLLRVVDGEFSHDLTVGGNWRVTWGAFETEMVNIWDQNPRHVFDPFVLEPNEWLSTYPNPGPAHRTLRFHLAGAHTLRIRVEGTDAIGSPVLFQREIYNEFLDGGQWYEIAWDGKDNRGKFVPAGMYRAVAWVSRFGEIGVDYMMVGS